MNSAQMARGLIMKIFELGVQFMKLFLNDTIIVKSSNKNATNNMLLETFWSSSQGDRVDLTNLYELLNLQIPH